MTEKLIQHLRADRLNAVARLCDLLRIPSVSTDPAFASDCRSAAQWVHESLESCGLHSEICETKGHPVVLARCDDAGPEAPRLLFYGHYDVQPPDPLEKWTTPPFEPTVRDGKLFARGASDDKGQVMCFIEALRAWKTVTGKLPINVTVMIEGEEESGSVSLDGFIDEYRESLRADIAAISDSSMWAMGKPAITYALRGLAYFDVQLHGPSRDLHSGVYGGTIANPATELLLVLGQLFDENHAVTIPGFYDDVLDVSDEERSEWEKLDFDETQWANSIGLQTVHGEKGFSTLERRWARPSCDVNGIYGGYMGEGAKTVIPTFAGAKVSFRVAAKQDPQQIDHSFRQWLEERTPPGCRWKIREHGLARSVIVSTQTTEFQAACRALKQTFGIEPVKVREGATIPVVATLKEQLGLDTLLIGFGLNDDNLHSPNEKFDLENFYLGAESYAVLLQELANGGEC